MAENPRQEIEIPFAGKTFRARPTWRVLAAIEAATDQPARVLGMKMLSVGLPQSTYPEASLVEIATVLHAIIGVDAGMTADEIGERLVDDGFGDLMAPLGLFLTRAQRGNKEHERLAAEDERKAREAAGASGAADPPNDQG